MSRPASRARASSSHHPDEQKMSRVGVHGARTEPESWLGLLDNVLDDPFRFRRAVLLTLLIGALLLGLFAAVGSSIGAAALGVVGTAATVTVRRSRRGS